MRKFPVMLSALLASVALLSACATPSQSGSSYSGTQSRREMTVRLGVVESVRQVTIDGSQEQGTGAMVGGVIGGIAGSNIGGGNRGSAVGSILGAVGGAIAGKAIEGGMTKKAGLEITVRLENGTLTAITQEADEQFHAGERVRILTGGGVTRVSH